MKRPLRFALAISLPAALLLLAGLIATAEAQEVPSKFTNLQVLPEDITKDELLQTMKLITKSLGVKCEFCHRTETRDYASDEIKEKLVARKMMQMVERMNRELFNWEDAPKATCFMCHRGERKPQMQPQHAEGAATDRK